MSYEDFTKFYYRIIILKSIHPDWNIKMFPILLEPRDSVMDFLCLQTYAIKIKQKIPKGKNANYISLLKNVLHL